MKFFEKNNNRAIRVFLKTLCVFLLCLTGLYLYEVFPRFIKPSISLPPSDYSVQIWTFPTYSVVRPGRTRFFTWREFAIHSNESIPEKESRQLILNHFDKQLQAQGWVRNEYDPNSYTNCYDEKIFPEAAFLHSGQDFSQDGFVTYKKEKVFSLVTSKENDELCLAVWRHWENVTGVFNIVLFTIKPSPFTWILFRNEYLFFQ